MHIAYKLSNCTAQPNCINFLINFLPPPLPLLLRWRNLLPYRFLWRRRGRLQMLQCVRSTATVDDPA